MEPNFANPSTNSLMDKFEMSFQLALSFLTKDEQADKDELKVDVENTIANFIDLARQMECFFLQKRFQLSQLKPELLLKEENIDIRHEIARKDELLKKHAGKIAKWKEFLSDNSPATAPIPPQNPGQMNPNIQIPPQQQQQVQPMQIPPSGIHPPGGMHPQMQQQMHMQPGFGVMSHNRPPFAMAQQNNPLAFLEKHTNNLMEMGGPPR